MTKTISETESKEILLKISEHNGPISLYNAKEFVEGDWDRKERVIEYMANIGLLEFDSKIDPKRCTITKTGFKLILKDEDEKEDEKVNFGKTEALVERENKIINYLGDNPWSGPKEITEQLNEDSEGKVSRDAVYQNLCSMVEEEQIQVKKVNRKNVYAVLDELKATTETIENEPELKENVEDEIGVKVIDVTSRKRDYISDYGIPLRNEGFLISTLIPYSTQITVTPMDSRSEIIAVFNGQDEIIKGFNLLPKHIQNSTTMTIIPEDKEFNLTIIVEIPSLNQSK